MISGNSQAPREQVVLTALPPPPAPKIEWRQLRPRLWVGRIDGEHLGTIERGRDFIATDTEGGMRRGYPSLQAAQAALTGEIATTVTPQQARDPRRIPAALLIGTTFAMLASVALSTTGIAILE